MLCALLVDRCAQCCLTPLNASGVTVLAQSSPRMQREEKKSCIVEHLLCSCDSATTVLNETHACLYFVLPKGNLNGYIYKSRIRGDGRCGAGTGSRLPQPAGRCTYQGCWVGVSVKNWALPVRRHPNTQVISRRGPVPLNRS
jgi:hypothetical protein